MKFLDAIITVLEKSLKILNPVVTALVITAAIVMSLNGLPWLLIFLVVILFSEGRK